MDIGRAMSAKLGWKIATALTEINGEYLYDNRWETKEKGIEPPQIVVFTTELPPHDAFSSTRLITKELKDGICTA